jgi:hypothetical protein
MSHHRAGTSRHQVSFGSLDDPAPCPLKGVAPDNPVRIVDAFVHGGTALRTKKNRAVRCTDGEKP